METAQKASFYKFLMRHQQHCVALALRTEGNYHEVMSLCCRFLWWTLCALWAQSRSMAMLGELIACTLDLRRCLEHLQV